MKSVQYTLMIPPQWNEFSLTEKNISKVARKSTDNIIKAIPSLERKRAQLRNFWQEQLSHAKSVGINHVASYFEQAEDNAIILLMQVQIMPLPVVDPDDTVLDTLYDAYSRPDENSLRLPDIAIINHPNVGKGIRSISYQFLDEERTISDLEMVVMRSVFPLNTCVFAVNFMTPNVGEITPLMELFELIVSTLHVSEETED
ncbi:hypothetical protein EJ419_02125 [Alloscardovia theropitheci]|uniref:Uncharacterized protein n=1 Tax=Alloscardovia theropitheci TaxID=2496842 RepID=A0A4R0QQQ3_9BIFI|nr:hypothetical protein [Alloscardovia theropitheci]TCD54653.1 hypothetical protein EJ419_02125 [Alloscardovia theropitheci]